MDSRFRNIFYLGTVAACSFGMSCCSDLEQWNTSEESAVNKINVVGVDTEEMIVSSTTRAAQYDAETIKWLRQPLKEGLDITYGLYNVSTDQKNEKVAILKLVDSDGPGGKDYDKEDGSDYAKYTFTYREDQKEAIWHNNGYHYFQGVHVPDRIRYTSDVTEVDGVGKAPNLSDDQHNATADIVTDAQLGNYTLLSHYLGMPANFRLTATVERIKLPFRHRLARVVAFVLIDPVLNTTLKGYYKKDASGNVIKENDKPVLETDPTNVSIRFCNVKVLQGVHDQAESSEGDGGHHTLTPTWGVARKIIPHFEGEKGSYNYRTMSLMGDEADFKFYYKESGGKNAELYPTSDGWQSAHDATGHNGYTEVNYGKVPVYDVIVRPTYTNTDNVMYDEVGYTAGSSTTKTDLANQTNKIDFEIELENGLRYEKTFEFDLNANYQTVVYLRISREHVDYNAAGSDLWIEDKNSDGWYGVNNENGNTLSKAGSSWQRAYTSVSSFFSEDGTYTYNGVVYPNGVTDGQFYNADKNENENAQYYTSEYDDKWIEKFLQAYKGGAHHGDYFILNKPITIDARKIPKDFVFTGHLDGQDHAITLTNTGVQFYKNAVNITDPLFTRTGETYSAYTVPTLYRKNDTREYYTSDEIIEVNGTTYVKNSVDITPAVNYTQAEIDAAKAIVEADGYVNGSNPEAETTAVKTTNDEKTPAVYDTSHATQANVGDVKTGTLSYDPVTVTLELLLGNETLYLDNQGQTTFTHPTALYQEDYKSPSYLFAGLDGKYTTAQESDVNATWEANVHKESNDFGVKTHWVPTSGYRAEVLNLKVVDGTLFPDDATFTGDNPTVSGNVQNCYNGTTSIPNNTPAIPQYK